MCNGYAHIIAKQQNSQPIPGIIPREEPLRILDALGAAALLPGLVGRERGPLAAPLEVGVDAAPQLQQLVARPDAEARVPPRREGEVLRLPERDVHLLLLLLARGRGPDVEPGQRPRLRRRHRPRRQPQRLPVERRRRR